MYKDIQISINIDEKGLFYACSSVGVNVWHFKDFNSCLEKAQKKLDEWLSDCPRNYKELAEKIRGSVEWSGYDEFDINPETLKTIIEKCNWLKK